MARSSRGTRAARFTTELEPALAAVALHSTLALDENIDPRDVVPLEPCRLERDAVSILGQYAAHLSFLRFAGRSDGEFRAEEWRVVRQKNRDARLIRARLETTRPASSPDLTRIEQLRTIVGGPSLPSMEASWGRGDSVFIDALQWLVDEGHDSTSLRSAAFGAILGPGPESMALALSDVGVTFPYDDERLPERLRQIEPRITNSLLFVGGAETSPLVPFSAFGDVSPSMTSAALAEQLYAAARKRACTIVLRDRGSLDSRSREVLDLLRQFDRFSWIVPRGYSDAEATSGSEHRVFVVAPTVAFRETLRERLEGLAPPAQRRMIDSLSTLPALSSLLFGRALPHQGVAFDYRLPDEPHRSYLAALAVLGDKTPVAVAEQLLSSLGCNADPTLLCPDLLSVRDGQLEWPSESLRRELAATVGAPYRESLARLGVAMLLEHGARPAAAALLFELRRYEELLALIEQAIDPEMLDLALRLPREILQKSATLTNAAMRRLLEQGRYLDVLSLGRQTSDPHGCYLTALAERRLGRYEQALKRLDGIEGERVPVLRAELLRLLDREADASAEIASAIATSSGETRDELLFQKALLAEEETGGRHFAAGSYFALRLETYAQLQAGDYEAARKTAIAAAVAARDTTERLDAELDELYADFLRGAWPEARLKARAILLLCEETQGDRSAAGALFTLAFLSADEAMWEDAESKIDRLRAFYARFGDGRRRRELDLLSAHLLFSQGRFQAALPLALSLLDQPLSRNIVDAARLIVEECRWIAGETSTPFTSPPACLELADRAAILSLRCGNALKPSSPFNLALTEWESSLQHRVSDPPPAGSASEQLKIVRAALGWSRRLESPRLLQIAHIAAQSVGVEIETSNTESGELPIMQRVGADVFPFAEATFGAPWRFAARNRIGNWTQWGPLASTEPELESHEQCAECLTIAENGHLHVAGADRWSAATRNAIAEVVRTKWEHHNQRRLLNAPEEDQAAGRSSIEGIIGESQAIRVLLDKIQRVARNDFAVTIIGESGSGKELVARALHRLSTRRGEALMAVNCAALPENLIESELFGHVRGAFTGADRDRIGLIESADRGTLFLDEIGELPLTAQAKLLRFLQEREFRRVGDSTTRHADVRIIAATHRQLDVWVDQGRFREDLYYRIKVIELSVPPLRERSGDVILLARAFLAAERARARSGPDRFSDHVEALFQSYEWRGNVRELQNTVRAAFALAGDSRFIDVQHLPERIHKAAVVRRTGSYHDEVTRFRRLLIEQALEKSSGNQNQAAKLLGMSRQALSYQIRELRIAVKAP